MAESLRELDARHLLHPFTDHRALHAEGPRLIEAGEGVWVHDAEGRRLLDGLSGLWCVNVGYGCERIVRAVEAQLRRLPFYPTFFHSASEPAIRLAERLAGITPPGLGHTLFCTSGSEANEAALKLIRAVWKRRGEPERRLVLSRHYAYHGVTFGATSVTGLEACHTPFDLPLADFAVHAPAPYRFAKTSPAPPAGLEGEALGRWCLDQTRALVERTGPERFAALFAEPIQGAGGVIVPPPGYLAGLRQLARDYSMIFVADEVITGFGRLGAWFASELFGLEPDVLTLAKGITSGYLPLGATVVSDELAAVLEDGGSLMHGHTYAGHPTCAAAALANLDEIEERGLLAHVRDHAGPQLQERLALFASHPLVAEVRGYGLIGALELAVPPGAREPAGPLSAYVTALAREEGVIVRGLTSAVGVAPPLPITEAELDVLAGALGRALDRAWKELGS